MTNEFKDIIDIFDEDKVYSVASNGFAIQITEIDLTKEVDNSHSYVTRLSFLNRKFYTNFSMNEFREILEIPFQETIKQFTKNFIAYFKEDTSSYQLYSSLHTLYAYSLGFIPKSTTTISKAINGNKSTIVIQIDVLKQEVYAFDKAFLKILFETEKELDNQFLEILIDNMQLETKFLDYYNQGISTNSPEVQEYLNTYCNE